MDVVIVFVWREKNKTDGLAMGEREKVRLPPYFIFY